MALLIAPASAFDFAEVLDDGGVSAPRIGRGHFGLIALQVASGGTVTMRAPGGALVMMGGLFPAPDGWAEIWWAIGPAARAHLREALRVGRALLDQVGRDAAPLEVRAHVPLDSVAGHRIAPMFGLQREGRDQSMFGEVDIWVRRFTAPESEV